MIDDWRKLAERDDWHTQFVGSDIRKMIGEITRMQAALEEIRTLGTQTDYSAKTLAAIADKALRGAPQ